jgi:hypothetical protein
MVYVRKKRVKDRDYHQLVESYREDGKVRQRVLVHLGEYPTVDAALEGLPERIALSRRVLPRYPKRIQPGMERRVLSQETRLSKLRGLRKQGKV